MNSQKEKQSRSTSEVSDKLELETELTPAHSPVEGCELITPISKKSNTTAKFFSKLTLTS